MKFDKLTGITIKSTFFGDKKFELFPNSPNKKRVALIYGANGSGKTTIAEGFREYTDFSDIRNIKISLLENDNIIDITPEERMEKIFVFDEEYINQNIKIQEKGLDTIVLFGKQIEIEKQIKEKEKKISEIQKQIEEKKKEKEKFENTLDINSPEYWFNEIKKKLQVENGWAETAGRKIKGKLISNKVTNEEINRIGRLNPEKREDVLKKEFDEKFKLFSGIDIDTKIIEKPVTKISYPENLDEKLNNLLSTIPKRPELTEREKEIYDYLGLEVITSAKGFLSVISHKVCTTCLQEISEEYRKDTLETIDHILNREIEEYRNKLTSLYLEKIELESYTIYKNLDVKLFSELSTLLLELAKETDKINQLIKYKYDNPFEKVTYTDIAKLVVVYDCINEILVEIEDRRKSFNGMVKQKEKTKKELLELNDFLAHYIIKENYDKLLSQCELKDKCKLELEQLNLKLNECEKEQKRLNSQRQNFNIALEKINESLQYIFYSRDRLKLELGSDGLYHLKTFGNDVPPNKISCGERNALALCYYFTEISKGKEVENLYKDEMLLIIDDPISSFDLDNRIGILSFIKSSMDEILMACRTTKVILMTHDISVFFDLEKVLNDISKHCNKSNKTADVSLLELVNKNIFPSSHKKCNEYTRLLKCIYKYANGDDLKADLTIGNTMRRALEAFSTFCYKKGIEDLASDDKILNIISDDKTRKYFRNLMYRLVLNNESHFQDLIRSAPETMLWGHLSVDEKKRMAKDVLCFIYQINKLHLISHLNELPNVKIVLDSWCREINN